jgi:hypothetical protein
MDGTGRGFEDACLSVAWADSRGDLLRHTLTPLFAAHDADATQPHLTANKKAAEHWAVARRVLAESIELLRRWVGPVEESVTHLCVAVPVAMSCAIWPWMQLPWLLQDMGCVVPDTLELISIALVAVDSAQECEGFLVCACACCGDPMCTLRFCGAK